MKLLALAACIALTGCATAVTQQMLDGADLGPRPAQAAAEDAVRSYFNATAIDSDSLKFRSWGRPVRGYTQATGLAAAAEPDAVFGYFIALEVNGKNRFGGYTGWQRHVARMAHGRCDIAVNLDRTGSSQWLALWTYSLAGTDMAVH